MGSLAQFEVKELIGKGHYSEVYRAIAKEDNSNVALKRVQIFDMDSASRKLCQTEAYLLQTFDHPNIIKYVETFVEQNELFIVMEFAQGGDLSQLIAAKRQGGTYFDEREIWKFFYDICGGLKYMHSLRVMHRDIKPANVYIDQRGVLKLGDLGLARYFSALSEQAFSMVGTPYYMSPEMVNGQPYSFNSDLWSLGCLLYELANLVPPFHGAHLNYYLLGQKINSCDYEPIQPHYSPQLRELVFRLIQVDPASRISANDALDFATRILMGRVHEFEILGSIGRGKYSEVHPTRRRETNETVALKKVQIFDMETEARKECITEVDLLRSLHHPNIINYIDSFVEESELYIVLELADVGDLSHLTRFMLESNNQFTELQIWAIFIQICEAVLHMHECRIMHRDIKPSNVFITSSGVVKLGDLGLGRYFSSKTNRAYSVVGTPYYMSPEVINNNGYDFKSDIWSLGCLLYELATLRSPFQTDGVNYYLLGKIIRSCQYPPVPETFSTTLSSLVQKMIQSRTEDRLDIFEVHNIGWGQLASLLNEQGVDLSAVDPLIAVAEVVEDMVTKFPKSMIESQFGSQVSSDELMQSTRQFPNTESE
eukprot:GILJ01009603.1.p1 GENE.GILJ01009603.1~~GILJ01009603.1.p1  ORF type:complete len:597 (+),score=75.73 GILJ01009603.1:27-1817(+)